MIMQIPHHDTYEDFKNDFEWARKCDDYEMTSNIKYWRDQHENIKAGRNHKVILPYGEYADRLESRLMERMTLEYMKYELSQNKHKNPILQDLYNVLESVRPKDGKLYLMTVSFSPKLFDESKLLDLSRIMNRLKKNTHWLDTEDYEFKWQVEQRNNPDQDGYSGFHVHCTFKGKQSKSRIKTTIFRGALGKYIEAENFVDIKPQNGKVNENYMGVLKKDKNKLLKQIKDREIQLMCPGSLVVPEVEPHMIE
jgi:hypothetical protein